jgi:hypothetical protein
MNGTDLQIQKTALKDMLQRLDAIAVTCRSCEHFSNVRCVKYDAVPPPDTIATGCPEWEFDGVPF